MKRKTLQDFEYKSGVWGQAYSTVYQHKLLLDRLAEKAISGATLSQRDRWQIAELLTGKTYQEPKRRGRVRDPDDDVRLWERFCEIGTKIETEGKTKAKKIESEAYKKLVEEERTSKHTPEITTVIKAVKRGCYESIRRKS